jgi:O-antigen ligase
LFDKGEGLRTIGLYGALISWLILTFSMKKVTLSRDIITYGFLVFLTSTILSSFFSIDPSYSLSYLKRDILKSAITFFIISSYFDTRMLLRLSGVICFSGIIILTLGLHSYILDITPYYTSKNMFLSVHYNEYGYFLGFFLPFFFMFFVKAKQRLVKGFWGMALFWGMFATLLSSSRAAMGNIFAVFMTFSIFLIKKTHLKLALTGTLITATIIIVSFNFWPKLAREHILSFPKDLMTFNLRTTRFWEPALEAAAKRPFLGWGYGKKIAQDPRPFEDGKKPHPKLKGGLHSTFITTLFQQGFFGLLSYLFLLLSTSYILFKIIRTETDERKLLALAMLSIIIGSFFVNSFLLSVPLKRIAPVLGMSSALFRNRSRYLNGEILT